MQLPDRAARAYDAARWVATHEETRHHPVAVPARYLAWQVGKRLLHRPVIIRVFGGMRLRCDPDRRSASAALYFHWPDWPEMHFLHAYLRPGDRFLDGGANVGLYTLLAYARVAPTGRVLSFEADPGTAAVLRANLRLNGLSEDGVTEAALSDVDGVVRFDTGDDTLGRVHPPLDDRPARAIVPSVRLDGIVAPSEDLAAAKLDLEGYELSALHGAAGLLVTGTPPVWLVETNHRCVDYGATRLDLQDLFADFGYRLYQALGEGDALRPIPRGGPYPENALAIADLDRVRARVPGLGVVA